MLQLANDLVSAGRHVVLLDEHPGGSGIARTCGVSSRKDLQQALRGQSSLDELISRPSANLSVIPAARVAGMDMTIADEVSLAGNLALLRRQNDSVMIDCVHRAATPLSPLARLAEQIVMVVPAEDSGLTPAYGLIKRMLQKRPDAAISVAVVRASSPALARTTFDKLYRVALDHLGARLQYAGAALTPGALRLSLPLVQGRPLHADGVASQRGIADSMV